MEKDNIKAIGYMPLLYGKDYLKVSLLSVINHVEKMVILYTDKPSYGFGTAMKNPDTEQELLSICQEVCGDKLIWHKVTSGNEGDHRGQVYQYSDGFDVIVAIDSDEIFDEEDLKTAINRVYNGSERYYGVDGYINLWRSFGWACYDGYRPIRFTNLHNENGENTVNCKIWHFSTAQTIDVTKYKIDIHGHKNEIRPNWFNKTFSEWNPNNPESCNDLHLVAIGLWNATPYDKTLMPSYLKEHKFYDKEIIE